MLCALHLVDSERIVCHSRCQFCGPLVQCYSCSRLSPLPCSMCLFVQNQDFQRHTEFVLNLLYSAGAAASERLVSINDSLAAHSHALGDVSGRLSAVARQQVPAPQPGARLCHCQSTGRILTTGS